MPVPSLSVFVLIASCYKRQEWVHGVGLHFSQLLVSHIPRYGEDANAPTPTTI